MTSLREFSGRSGPKRGRRRVRPMYETLEVRTVPSGVVASFAVTQDWGSGFQASLGLANSRSASVDDWTLEFDYKATIGDIWDASIVSRTGDHYVIRGAGWNDDIAAGGVVAFGFIGSPGHTTSDPANYVLNGVPLNGEPATPSLAINDVSATEPTSGSSPLQFTVGLSSPTSHSVTVQYATIDATAKAGSDYQAASGSITFAPGETSKTIVVSVLADGVAEGEEKFGVVLSNSSGANLARAQGIGVIKDAAPAPPTTGDVTFRVTNDWGSGFNGQITVKNAGATAWASWTLEFDFAGRISSLWNGVVASHVGDHYVIRNASYNGAVARGAKVSFGFTASPGNVTAGPTHYVVNGGGPANHQPGAHDDTAWTSPGQVATIPVLANDSDPDGDSLSIVSAAQGLHGVVAVVGGAIRYTPAVGFAGSDSFAYTISDGRGGTAVATVAVTVSNLSWPAHVFAPYVDMGLYPTYNLVAAAQGQGLKYFNLGFVVADANNKPSWAGYTEYEINGGAFDQAVRSQVNTLRGLGGDVAVSFGGAANQELALAITNVDALQGAYQSVIDAYGLTRVDFDIEGAAAADRASVDRRSEALAALQRHAVETGKPLQVWFTLPVLPAGLTHDGLYVIQSALAHGVTISGVNVMAMDYGDSAAPSPNGRMGDYAIQAATSTFKQLKSLYGGAKTDSQLWAMIGVTPMIGLNDVTTEVFDQTEARELLAFATEKGMGQIAMWSLNRDRQNPNGSLGYVDNSSSSILQDPYEFASIFKPFTS